MTSPSQIYSDRVLEIAGLLPENRRLAAPQARVRKVSRVCGSTITVDICVTDGAVSEYAQDVNACALGQTSASIVSRHILGASTEELRRLRDDLAAMLKAGGPPPAGARWDELKYLEPVRDYPARHTSTMLVFEAVVACLDEIEGHATDA